MIAGIVFTIFSSPSIIIINPIELENLTLEAGSTTERVTFENVFRKRRYVQFGRFMGGGAAASSGYGNSTIINVVMLNFRGRCDAP